MPTVSIRKEGGRFYHGGEAGSEYWEEGVADVAERLSGQSETA